jgi:hypothetical protein
LELLDYQDLQDPLKYSKVLKVTLVLKVFKER